MTYPPSLVRLWEPRVITCAHHAKNDWHMQVDKDSFSAPSILFYKTQTYIQLERRLIYNNESLSSRHTVVNLCQSVKSSPI